MIDLVHHAGSMEIRRAAPVVRLETTAPELRVQSAQLPQVEWDRSDYRVAVNVLLPTELGRAMFSEARAASLGAIADISAEGDALSRIERGNTIASVALASQPQDERELTLAAVPPLVRTNRQSGNLDIQFTQGAIRATADLTPVEVHATRSSVTVHTEVPSEVNVQV